MNAPADPTSRSRIPRLRRAAIFLRAATTTFRVCRWLRKHNFEWVYRRLEQSRKAARPAPANGVQVSDVLRATRAARRWVPYTVRCLEDSLVLHHLLTRAGIPNTFCVGVQPLPFTSHAWVEHQGIILNGGEHECRSLGVIIARGNEGRQPGGPTAKPPAAAVANATESEP